MTSNTGHEMLADPFTPPTTALSPKLTKTPNDLGPPLWPENPKPWREPSPAEATAAAHELYNIPPSFPPPVEQPQSIPVRLKLPQTVGLATLDAQSEADEYCVVGDKEKEANLEDLQSRRNNFKKATKILRRHIEERAPYAQFASERIQAVVRVRNNDKFELPDEGDLARSPFRPAVRSPDVASEMEIDSASPQVKSKKGKIVKDRGKPRGRNEMTPRVVQGMHVVDRKTGKGLRNFLLAKGKECGMRKRECKSISFHDFTPNIRTNAHQNVLLGHFGSQSASERVDVYEVDLPTVSLNLQTGLETHKSETWIWILIQRPLLSLCAHDTSTIPLEGLAYPGDHPSALGKRLKAAVRNTVLQQSAYQPADGQPLEPPPNFVEPDRTSWIVFAAPKANVNEYPETVEKELATPPPSTDPTANITISANYNFLPNGPGKPKKVHKRIDYDFSHQGVPIFEFFSQDIFVKRETNFLSVENIGGWHYGDPYEPLTDEEYKKECENLEGPMKVIEGGEEVFIENGIEEVEHMVSPNKGLWWKEFYERVQKDVARWKRVKRAMGMGYCRVVLRWEECEDAQRGERGSTEWRGGLKERIGGEENLMVDGKMKRVTRSESRRRSGMGMGSGLGLGIQVVETSSVVRGKGGGKKKCGV